MVEVWICETTYPNKTTHITVWDTERQARQQSKEEESCGFDTDVWDM